MFLSRFARPWAALAVVYLFFASTLSYGEIRKVTQEDIEWGDPATTVTSPGGHVGHRISTSSIYGPAWVDVRAYGAVGDGTTDDTTAIQAAIDSVTPTPLINLVHPGATIYFPPGVYKVSALTVSDNQIVFKGEAGWSTIQKASDVSTDLITVTGFTFRMIDLRLTEPADVFATWTNTGKLLKISNSNDHLLRNVWLYGGHDQLYMDHADVQVFYCTFEGARRTSVYGIQQYLSTFSGNRFHGTNLSYLYPKAAMWFEMDGAYSSKPYGNVITGNWFLWTKFGHHIGIDRMAATTISGNVFAIASQFDTNTKDDIYLDNTAGMSISGNVFDNVLNNYDVTRGSRYNINITAPSTKTVITGNWFKSGALGIINDLSSDATWVGNMYSNSIADRMTHSLEFTGGSYGIRNTSDLSLVSMAGGSSIDNSSLGAIIQVFGAESVGNPGDVRILRGDGTTKGKISLFGDYTNPVIIDNNYSVAPDNAAATCTKGEFRNDGSYLYSCTATNTWKRAAISTW